MDQKPYSEMTTEELEFSDYGRSPRWNVFHLVLTIMVAEIAALAWFFLV